MQLPLALRPLRHRDFALLWSGQAFSMLGNSVNTIALPWQVLQLTGSALQMGIVIAINIAANVLFLLFGGAIVDRVPRRRVLLISDFTEGAIFFAIAVLSATGALRVEHLYVAAAVGGAMGAFFFPAMTAIIPELVPQEVLVAGNALRGFSRQGARVFGPVLGGVLVASAGPAAAFAFNGVTFFVSFAALVAMRSVPVAARARTGILREIREGVTFVFSLPWIWVTIAIFGVVNAFVIGSFSVGLPVLLKEVLRVDAATFGLVFASQGVGEAAGGVLLGQVRTDRSGLAMYLFTLIGGIGVLGFATSSLVPVLLFSGALWGLSFVGFGVLWDSALQKHVPRELLGRVSSVDWFGSLVLAPLGPLVAGDLVARFGPSPIFTASALSLFVATALALLIPSIRRLE